MWVGLKTISFHLKSWMIHFSVCTQRISCLSPADRYFRRCISWTEYPMRAGFLAFSAETLLLLYICWNHSDWSKIGIRLIGNKHSPISCLFSLHTQSGNQSISFTKKLDNRNIDLDAALYLYTENTCELEQCILMEFWSKTFPYAAIQLGGSRIATGVTQ